MGCEGRKRNAFVFHFYDCLGRLMFYFTSLLCLDGKMNSLWIMA